MPSKKKRKVKLAVRSASGIKRSRSFFYANPHPAPSRMPVNADTVKSKTYTALSIPLENVMTNVPALVDSVARGSGDNERIGTKWNPTALHLKGFLRAASLSNLVTAGYYVVWDKQPSGALAAFNEVFIGQQAPFMYPSASTSDRFRIICHRKFSLVTGTTQGTFTEGAQHIIDDYIKLPAGLVAHAQLGTTSGNVNDRVSGALLMYPYSSESDQAASRPTLTFGHRIYFNDV